MARRALSEFVEAGSHIGHEPLRRDLGERRGGVRELAEGRGAPFLGEEVDRERGLVVIGDAVTFLTEKFWELASQTSLLWRPVEDLHITLNEVVTWRAEDADGPVVRALIESAQEVSPISQSAAGRTRSSSTTKQGRRKA